MSEILDTIVNHLEFLGFTTEKIEPATDEQRLLFVARHYKRNTMSFSEMVPNFILFRIRIILEKGPSKEIDKLMNDINRMFAISRVFTDVDEGKVMITAETVYEGEYVKNLFSQFMDLFESDMQLLYEHQDYKNIIHGETINPIPL